MKKCLLLIVLLLFFTGIQAQSKDNLNSTINLFYYFIPIVLLIVVIAALSYRQFQSVERKLKSIQKKTTTSNSISDKDFYEAPLKKSQPQKSEIDKFIDNNDAIKGFQEAIFDLQKRVSDLERMQGKPAAAQGALSASVISSSITAKQSPPSGETFYMSGPVNNYFPLSVKSLTKENTVYKFIIKGNKQEAEYELHTSGAPIKEILGLRESYIKPACDEENLATYNVKNIVTVNPGIAMLEGDKWIIKTKALIRYE